MVVKIEFYGAVMFRNLLLKILLRVKSFAMRHLLYLGGGEGGGGECRGREHRWALFVANRRICNEFLAFWSAVFSMAWDKRSLRSKFTLFLWCFLLVGDFTSDDQSSSERNCTDVVYKWITQPAHLLCVRFAMENYIKKYPLSNKAKAISRST